MIVVTNRIRTKLGMAAPMAGRFTQGNELDKMKGFVRVEVLLTQNLTEYDELNVNMYWEDMESFQAWKNSDAFKRAHQRPEPESKEANQESPILGNEITVYEVASVKEAAAGK